MKDHVYQLNKSSLLVSVSADWHLNDLKHQLHEDGMHLGYAPLASDEYSINHYLVRRTPNLYHFMYGSIGDLVSSLHIELESGVTFQLHDAPRSAIGPDFNRFMIGSRREFGKILAATLKITPLPEHVMCVVIAVNDKNQTRDIIRHLVGHFAAPLYFCHYQGNQALDVLGHVNLKSKATEALVICLSGLSGVTMAISDILIDFLNSIDAKYVHCETASLQTYLRQLIHNDESYRLIKDLYRQILWPTTDAYMQSTLEKSLINSW